MFFGPQIQLFRLFGFPIRIDLSWLIIVILLTWSLGAGLFRTLAPGLSIASYFTMGLVGALGLFVCIVLHELAHALVARREGLQIRGITLFIFGGVAEMVDEPQSARAEFLVAIAGPIMSIVLAVVLYGGSLLPAPVPVKSVLWWLGIVNFVLVLFNMLPAFPLDGGRVFRSALWYWRNDLRWATRVSSTLGSWIGAGLIVLGVLRFVLGDFVGGMWFALIGMFLRNAAKMSYQQLQVRRALEGEPLSRFMRTDVVTAPPDISLSQLVDEYIYRFHYKLFPVTDHDGRLIGCISTRDVQQVPRDEWDLRRVEDVMRPCAAENTISADADATAALAKMSRAGLSRLVVVSGERLAGILTLKDLLRFISLKVELEDEDRRGYGRPGRREPAETWARDREPMTIRPPYVEPRRHR